MMMSRETAQQLKAVNSIISTVINHNLNKSPVVSEMLDNDIVEFLCEALHYPRNVEGSNLLQAIYYCLALLSSSDKFFTFHAMHTLESVLRSLHFICQYLSVSNEINKKEENPILSTGLGLIATILHGSSSKCKLLEGSTKVVEGGSTLNRLLELVTISMNLQNTNIKWKSGLVVRSLLNPWHLGKFFLWDKGNSADSVMKKNFCISRNICTNGNEIQRRRVLFNTDLQLIHTETKIQESVIFTGEHIDEFEPDTTKELELVITLIDQSLNGLQNCLTDILKAKQPQMKNQLLLLIFQIGRRALQLIPVRAKQYSCRGNSPKENKSLPENDDWKTYILKKLFGLLCQSIGDFSSNVLVEMELESSHENIYKEYIICLQLLYEKFGHFCGDLTFKLASQGYLTMIPFLLTSPNFRQDEEMRITSQNVLVHLLSKLSDLELNWPGSYDILNQGLTNLPMDLNSWPLIMAKYPAEAAATAILIYSYFYCASSSRPDIASPFLKPLVYFIRHIYKRNDVYKSRNIPTPILKALWFSFSISYLSSGCPINPDTQEASHKLIDIIWCYQAAQKNRNVSDIFTYHPAILLWVFSSPVRNKWLQHCVMQLWLQGSVMSKPSQEIEKLILNQDAFFCLMDIAEKASEKVMECAVKTIWHSVLNLNKETREKMSHTLWEILLQIIMRFCGIEDEKERERRALNVTFLMQLVQTFKNPEPSSSTATRLACLLNSALSENSTNTTNQSISRNHYLFYRCGLKMSLFLLNLSGGKGDTRVAYSMLNHIGQLRRLEWAASLCSLGKADSKRNDEVGNKDPNHKSISKFFIEDLNAVANLILERLILISRFHSKVSVKAITLNSWHLVNEVSSSNEGLCFSSLQLIITLLQNYISKPKMASFISLRGYCQDKEYISNTKFMRIMYLQCTMLCAKVSPEIESLCWQFLTEALKLPDKNLSSHFSKSLWNYSLLESRLPFEEATSVRSNSHGDTELLSVSFIRFLYQWLQDRWNDRELNKPNWIRSKKTRIIPNISTILLGKIMPKIGKVLMMESCGNEESSTSVARQIKSGVLKETITLVLKFESDIPANLTVDLKRKLSIIS